MLNRKLRYRIDTNYMYRSYTIYSSAVPHSCLIFKLRCQQNRHVASNSHICFEYSLLNRALVYISSMTLYLNFLASTWNSKDIWGIPYSPLYFIIMYSHAGLHSSCNLLGLL
jgi:hypothetical protein